jgi:hypothetical protein
LKLQQPFELKEHEDIEDVKVYINVKFISGILLIISHRVFHKIYGEFQKLQRTRRRRATTRITLT